MTTPVARITEERLKLWSRRLVEANATPLILIGFGHDQTSGQLVICTLDAEELDKGRIQQYLLWAIQELGK